MSNFAPSYQQYTEAWNRNNAADDAGNRPNPMSEQEWGQLSPYQQHQNAQTAGGMQSAGYDVGQDDPLYQQFYQQFGQNQGIANSGFELNNQLQTGLALGYDDGRNGVAGPQYGRLDWNQLALDPSRIMWLDPEGTEGRRYLYERSNARGDAVVGEQSREADSGLGDAFPAVGLGLVLGGGLLYNAFGTGGAVGGTTVPSTGTGAGGVVGGGGSAGGGSSLGGSILNGPWAPGQALRGAADSYLINNGMSGLAQSGISNILPGVGGSMNWTDMIRAGLNLYGQSRQPSMSDAAGQGREYDQQMWLRALQANRPNQSTPWASSSWAQDPQTGQWTQTQTLNPQDQQRLDMFRGIANQRMQAAQTPLQLDWSRINPRVAQWMQGGSLGGSQLNGGA